MNQMTHDENEQPELEPDTPPVSQRSPFLIALLSASVVGLATFFAAEKWLPHEVDAIPDTVGVMQQQNVPVCK